MKESGYGFYEQGRTKPDAAKLAIIADCLQVSVNELLDNDENLEYYINTWKLAGYDVIEKDEENIYITEKKKFNLGLLNGLLSLEKQEELKKYDEIMNRIKGITFSKKDFITITKTINDNSFAEALQISKRAIEKIFLLKALEESTTIAV